jgi:predicted transcriptional regulator
LRYRRRFEIIADILRVAGQGSKKTKIMFLANLSHLLLKKYLDYTLRAGFLKFDGVGYAVTDQGQAFLEHFTEFSSRSARVSQDVASLSSEEDTLNRMCAPKKAKNRKSRGCRRNGIGPL